MSRFLIATMAIPGHVAPFAPVVRTLVERGHEVVWYTSRFFADKVKSAGARFEPLKTPVDFGDSEYNKHFPERARLKGLAQIKFDFRNIFVGSAEGYLLDLREILETFPADVLLADPAVVAAIMLDRLHELPVATLNITVLGLKSLDVPPFGLGMLPDYSPLGKLRNHLLYFMADRLIFRDVNASLRAVNDKFGVPHTRFGPAAPANLYLQPSVPAFEYPRADVPPQLHFIGPLLPESPGRSARPSWWSDFTSSGKPIVLVTQGTIATNADELIRPTLEALANESVCVIATTGGKTADQLGFTIPANARVEPFIPFGAIMEDVSVYVTNGGYGGITVALAHGVPVVSAGSTEDKPEVSNRVAYAGVGINLKTATPTAQQVRDAVTTILANDRYRRRAQQFQSEFARYDADNTAADLLERLAATRRPVLRSGEVKWTI